MRWQAQLLGGSGLPPAAVVRRAVALQGQDLPAALRAVAIRSEPGTTVARVRASFDAGELVRSWPMRGTLFVTSPEHLATLLYFTAERTHRASARRRHQLGLADHAIERARELLRAALADRPLRRAQVLAIWDAAGIPTTGGRGYHLLAHLSVDGLTCWGPFDEAGSEQLLTLASLPQPPDPEASLAEVVRGFVAARGPVTEADLAWWTKLPKAVLRRAASTVGDLTDVRIDDVPGWVIGDPQIPDRSGVTLVPGFDEWILGYADRSLVASPAVLEALTPGGNGIFRPAILLDGRVVGTWRVPRSAGVPGMPVAEIVEPIAPRAHRAIDRALALWPHG
ncbi:winged helix DNA-binding domain-containing protein [Brooklawnia cerclae]|nr:winged helix DNA-binding domain-containing protein [Brooklawnia cerclae]